MQLKKAYFLLLIPLVLAILAIADYGFLFKAAVPGYLPITLRI